MPKEQPLQTLAPLKLILKPKAILPIKLLQQIQQLGARLHRHKRRALRIIHNHRNATIWVEFEEPVFLLLVGADVEQGVRV